MNQTITVLFFASLREQLQQEKLTVSFNPAWQTADDLRAHLSQLLNTQALEANSQLRCAVNHALANFQTPIAAGDTVAFFPPVTGG